MGTSVEKGPGDPAHRVEALATCPSYCAVEREYVGEDHRGVQ